MAKSSWAKNEKLRVIRVDPEVHKDIKIAAHEAKMPMKSWVNQTLRNALTPIRSRK